MKKVLKWGGIAVVAVIVIAIIAGGGGSSSNTEVVTNPDNSETVSSDGKDSTQTEAEQPAEKMTIKNSTVTKTEFGLTEVVGEVTNNDSVEHSATIKATFYNASGGIMGTASGAVNDVAPSKTKTFNLMSTDDVSGYSEFKVEVDTLL